MGECRFAGRVNAVDSDAERMGTRDVAYQLGQVIQQLVWVHLPI
jgi:hypothetical protein